MSNNPLLFSLSGDTNGQELRAEHATVVASDAALVVAGNCLNSPNPKDDQQPVQYPEELSLPPHSNTGGIDPYVKRQLGSKDGAFVDWLNFSAMTSSFPAVADDEVVIRLSNRLSSILGFGVTQQRPVGLFRYQQSYILGNAWGFICIGGQRDTVLTVISGQGCIAAKPGWERRLHDFLLTLNRPRITRVDLAHDCFKGEYSPDRAFQDYESGLFSLGGHPPDVEQKGNWIKPNGKGRTLEIGSRKSGKLTRVYEKGLQLGRGFSHLFPLWSRIEVELHNKDRQLPPDVLLSPGHYLAGSYPAFEFIHHKQSRIRTRKNTAKITYDAMTGITRQQVGKALNVMCEIEGTPEAVLAKVVREGMPKRLNDLAMDYRNSLPSMELQAVSLDKAFALSFRDGGK